MILTFPHNIWPYLNGHVTVVSFSFSTMYSADVSLIYLLETLQAVCINKWYKEENIYFYSMYFNTLMIIVTEGNLPKCEHSTRGPKCSWLLTWQSCHLRHISNGIWLKHDISRLSYVKLDVCMQKSYNYIKFQWYRFKNREGPKLRSRSRFCETRGLDQLI